MEGCNRAQAIQLDHGFSSSLCGAQTAAALPRARSFELAGDQVHYAPDRPADVKHVKLVISLNFEQETLAGTVSTTFSALYEEVTGIVLDAVELHIERVRVRGGDELAFSVDGKKLFVTLDRPYRHGEEFTLDVQYHAQPRSGLHFVKPAPEDPTRPVQVWTFGQPRYHSYWFPCYDAPNDRATTEIIVTVPARFMTISNGTLLGVSDDGDTRTHHWRHDIPHAAYLISLVVGDFAVIEATYQGKPVSYYVRPERKGDAHFYMGKTPEMMRFFSEFTGVEYPYAAYAQTVVELYMGAMEHTTATTHSFALLLDERAALDYDFVPIVAHELAHQWFGDLVTCRDWSNGWLNEGFATYFEELWNEHELGTDYFKQSMLSLKQGYLHEDTIYRRPIVYYVYHSDGFELFDGHMYNKGGWVLHMLRHQLGDATFRRAVRAYLERYREREVITTDLERTFEEISGRSLARFFQQWVYQGGYPAFEVGYTWDGEHGMLKLKIKQTQSVDELTPCFVTPVDLAFYLPGPVGDGTAQDEPAQPARAVHVRVMVGEDGQVEQSFYFPLEREPLMVRFDPDGWLLKTLKFERSSSMLRYQLAHDSDVLGRMEAAEALGLQSDAAAIEALNAALQSDAFWGVRVAAAQALGSIGGEHTQRILLQALRALSVPPLSRVRTAILTALGEYRAPQQAELAARSAQALADTLERGDISYKVEVAAAESLGATRSDGVVDRLVAALERPCWNYVLQRGIFRGLAATGEGRVLEIMASHLTNASLHPQLRAAASAGLEALAHNRHLYAPETRQQAVTALCSALEHDSWAPVRASAARALQELGERRVIDLLERTAGHELDTRAQRMMRVAAHALRSGDSADAQLQQLRLDLDQLRAENRQLKEQLNSLEARLT